jgi:hypothetical protein
VPPAPATAAACNSSWNSTASSLPSLLTSARSKKTESRMSSARPTTASVNIPCRSWGWTKPSLSASHAAKRGARALISARGRACLLLPLHKSRVQSLSRMISAENVASVDEWHV